MCYDIAITNFNKCNVFILDNQLFVLAVLQSIA